MIKKLEDHYLPGPQHAEDHQQLLMEWQKAKYDLLQWKENDLPQAICEGEGSTTTTDWCLSKLMQSPYRSHYPMLPFIAEVCLSCPVSNASPERGASMLKWQKNRLRSQIKNHLLNPLLHVSINGPKQQSQELPSLICALVAEWLKEKDRRKLKKLSPISATVTSSCWPSTAAVPEHPPPLDEATLHDLDLPSSMEVDDSQSINSELNVDAYVAALQFECDEKSHNMEDSNYESDYFSD